MGLFKKKIKEIKSDLHYKVKTNDDTTFDYKKNNHLQRKNRKKMTLAPGDWVEISSVKSLEYEERKFLNWMHIFYIKKRSLFNLIFQIILIVIYLFAYGFTIMQITNESTHGAGLASASFIKNVILFLPLLILVGRTAKTLSKAITIVGPNRALKNKFVEFQSITFRDKRNKKRTVVFDQEANMIEDEKGSYHYGDTVKISSSIYRFDLLIFNKNESPLHHIEYYNIQVDFRQEEGILVSKGKKLEHSVVELNEYPLDNVKKKK